MALLILEGHSLFNGEDIVGKEDEQKSLNSQ
jgi:hypothetical protein